LDTRLATDCRFAQDHNKPHGHSITSSASNCYRVGNGNSQRCCGSEIDHQLELGWLLDWQVAGHLSLENPAGINAGAAIRIGLARPGSMPRLTSATPILMRLIMGMQMQPQRRLTVTAIVMGSGPIA
jgi:hypothetical protein